MNNLNVIENEGAKILSDFQIEDDKMAVAYQLGIVVVDKWNKKAVLVDVVISSDINIRKKEHEKLEKHLSPEERHP